MQGDGIANESRKGIAIERRRFAAEEVAEHAEVEAEAIDDDAGDIGFRFDPVRDGAIGLRAPATAGQLRFCVSSGSAAHGGRGARTTADHVLIHADKHAVPVAAQGRMEASENVFEEDMASRGFEKGKKEAAMRHVLRVAMRHERREKRSERMGSVEDRDGGTGRRRVEGHKGGAEGLDGRVERLELADDESRIRLDNVSPAFLARHDSQVVASARQLLVLDLEQRLQLFIGVLSLSQLPSVLRLDRT